MNEKLRYPSRAALVSVLTKIGVDPDSRSLECQDAEYTTCDILEIEDYFRLYSRPDTSDQEKRVLGCYLLQCLEDHLSVSGQPHNLQPQILQLLHSEPEIHASELLYWGESAAKDANTEWFITPFILDRQTPAI